MTTRSSASTRSRRTTTIRAAGRAGPQSTPSSTWRSGTSCRRPTRRALEAASHLCQHVDGREVRRAEPAGAEAPGGAGTQLRPFSQEILEACLKASNELYAEISAKNPDFKKIDDDGRLPERGDLWCQVAERSFDNFMARMSASGQTRDLRSQPRENPAPAGLFLAAVLRSCATLFKDAFRMSISRCARASHVISSSWDGLFADEA